MADDADGSSEPLSGVALLNEGLKGLLDVLVGLQCLSDDADYIWQYGEHWDVLFDLDGDYYGLGWRPNNVSDATRRPRGVWVSDWQNEVIGWLRSEGVETRGLSSDELAAAASNKLGGWEFLLRPDADADYVAKAAGVGEVLKYVPQHVKGLCDGQAKADKAIQAFPAVVLTALDGLRGGSWRTRLRSELLNVACRWPGTKGQGMSARYVPAGAKAFISLLGEYDPRETWKKYIDLVEDARADILAAGGEVQPTTPAENVKQTAPLPAPVHSETDGPESPGEALRKLDRFDELMRGAQARNDLKMLPTGKTPPDELLRAAEAWQDKQSIPEFCELAAVLAEEAEFHHCAEGGRCFALVAKNWWQCVNSASHLPASINAHTLGQTIIELRAKLRADLRAEMRRGTALEGPTLADDDGVISPKIIALLAEFAPQSLNPPRNSGEKSPGLGSSPPPLVTANTTPAEDRVGTVAWLISQLGNVEWYTKRAADFGDLITKAVTKGSIEEHYRNKQLEEAQERDKHKAAIRKALGAEELQQWLNYHDIPWTKAGVEKQRDRLFVEQGVSRAEADALTLDAFLSRLRGLAADPEPTPPAPPATEATPVEPEPTPDLDAIAKLRPSHRKAYLAWKLAKAAFEPKIPTDTEAYEYLKENADVLFAFGTDLAGYQLPDTPASWSSYAQKGRVAHGERKYQPRAGRGGRSIVREDEI